MKEINFLVERAKMYLKSVEILLEEGDYESSVSRTYYAMFLEQVMRVNIKADTRIGIINH